MKITTLLVLVATLLASTMFGQSSQIDSLIQSLPVNPDTSRYDQLLNIADEWNKKDRSKGLPYYMEALSIAESINDINRLAHINKFIGVSHLYLANNDSSRVFLENASTYFSSLDDTLSVIGINTNLALIHQRENEYEEAVKKYHQVITDAENINEWVEVIVAKVNLASLLIDQEDYNQALSYLNSIDDDYTRFKIEFENRQPEDNLSPPELNKRIDENGDNQFILSNYPYIYINQGICYRNLEKLDSAIVFQNRAIDTAPNNAYVTSYAYHNLGEVYEEKENWQEAYNSSREALAGFESIKNVRGRTFAMNNLGKYLTKLGNYTAADTTLQNALDLAQEINFQEEIRDAYENRAENFAAKGNYTLAYENHKSFVEFKDSISNESRINAIQEWETKYETEKERDEVARLELENQVKTERQQNQLILFVLGIIGLLGIGLFVYSRYKIKKERQVAQYERQTNQVMAKFVPMEYVQTLGKKNIKDIALGDQVEKEVTVVFTDIRNFTSISEIMSPQENFTFVKEYVEQMSPIIHKNGGFINQYLGDGIMAIFQNSPADALTACIQMNTQVDKFNAQIKQRNMDPIRVGMGMHTGMLVMGIIGDENRMDAAIISDTVNTAARMESLTKAYGNQIILSEASIKKMTDSSNFHFRELGKAMVKGKAQPLNIFECINGDAPAQIQKKLKSIIQFNEGVESYFGRNFDRAESIFQQIYSNNPDDLVAYSFIKRSHKFVEDATEEDFSSAKY